MAEPSAAWILRRPAPALAHVVERYIGYRAVGFPPGIHRGLPSRHQTFIVSIGPAIDVVAQTDPRQAPGRYRAVLSGLQASPALIAHDGNQEGVAIELTPPGCRALFGLPAAALWDTTLELADLAGSAGVELWERLQGDAPWERRFAIVDEVLTRLSADEDPVEPALRRTWGLITASAGALPVEDLARTVGWSRQHLARRFAGEYGLTPKLAARVVRFERARRLLDAPGPARSIAEVAATCGFYDQAHLNRDFVLLAGCSPGRYLASGDLPSVQDDEATAPAA
jgi:AraC-like DNA-binding protein